MNAQTFTTAGQTLFGSVWQRELARTLELNERSIRYYAAGTRAIPETIQPRLVALLTAKAQICATLANKLERKN